MASNITGLGIGFENVGLEPTVDGQSDILTHCPSLKAISFDDAGKSEVTECVERDS